MTAPSFSREAFIPEIEQNVLGSLLFGGDARDLLALLDERHFIERFHQHLYRAIKAARQQYGSANPVVVAKLIPQAEKDDFLKVSGWETPKYIGHLLGSATAGPATLENARKIINQWARLAMADMFGRMQALCNDPQSDVRLVAPVAAKELDDISAEVRAGAVRKSRVSIGSAMQRVIDTAEEARNTQSGLTGITWGLSDLNRMTGGIQRRDLTLIGARPSMGKSTVAFSVALKAAKKGHCCGIISLEMDADKVAARMASDFMYDWRGKIPYVDMIRNELDQTQRDQMKTAHEEIEKLQILIDEQSGQTMTDIRVRAERMMEESTAAGNPLAVLFIDHLGLIRPSSRYSGNRTNEIAEITSAAKSLARELNIAVVLLSQLNRSLETREEKRPQLSDLRDSGAIEQDADMIAFLFREAYYLEREQGGSFEAQADRAERIVDVQHKLEFIIAKQRNGPLGTVELFADMPFSAVRNGVQR